MRAPGQQAEEVRVRSRRERDDQQWGDWYMTLGTDSEDGPKRLDRAPEPPDVAPASQSWSECCS